MKRIIFFILILAMVLAMGGCGGAVKENAAQDAVGGSAAPRGGGYDSNAVENEKAESQGVQSDIQQKIITTVSMTLVVPDVQKAVQEIESLLKNAGGYMQEANLWQTDNRLQGHLTLRVPSAEVDGLIPRLEELGQVERKNTSGQNVTEEYYDVQARKNNLQRQEERYLELLGKADTVQEMIEIENQLARVRGEIESMQARLKVLDNRVDLATINIDLRAPRGLSTGEILREPFGERIQTGWHRGVNGMINFVQDLVILFVILLPYTPILALVGYGIYRVNKKRRGGKTGNIGNGEDSK